MKILSFLRVTLWLALVALGVVLMIPVGFFLFFNPNDFKQEIATFITQKSGLPLEIQGEIEMSYFPWLGISVNNVSLPQAPPFEKTSFIQINSLSFKIPVRALLQQQLIVENLTMTGLQINLIKKQDGSTNWEGYTNRVKEKTAPKAIQENPPNTLSSPKKKLSFKLSAFALNDAKITFEDPDNIIKISDLTFKAQAGKSPLLFPAQGQFKMLRQNAKHQTTLSGQSDFEGVLNVGNPKATLNAALNLNLPQNISSPLTLTFQANLDPSLISLNNIHLKAEEHLLTGKVDIPVSSDKPITFSLNMKQLNLDNFTKNISLPKTSSGTKTLATTSPVTTPLPKGSNKQIKKQDKSRVVKGNIHIDKLITNNLTLNHVKALVHLGNDYIKVNPITADLYQGALSLALAKDLNKPNSPIALQGALTQIQIQPFLNDLKQEKRITGTATVHFNLIHHQDLEGIVKINIFNGIVDAIDLRYYLALAQSLLKKEIPSVQNTKQTPFGNLSATLNLHDKMIDNNDLTITASDFTANGEGSLYLGSQTIQYNVEGRRKYKDNEAHPNAYPLAIRIKGPLAHPKIEPDMDLYLKKGVEQQLKKQLNKQIEKNLGKLIGNGANPEEGDGSNSPQELLQQKIEDKLNKGLKKLFKKRGE